LLSENVTDTKDSETYLIRKLKLHYKLLYNDYLNILLKHKLELEYNYGNHQLVVEEKFNNGKKELYFNIDPFHSDFYIIELLCNDKKIENINLPYKYSPNEIKDSIEIKLRTIHLINGVRHEQTRKFK